MATDDQTVARQLAVDAGRLLLEIRDQALGAPGVGALADQASHAFLTTAVAILFGASLSFLTPIGYQANTLIWGLGGYRYRDFARLGAPLSLATIVMVLVMVPIVFPLR